ncbi:TusE/DsrC/DsvC family sulfur relay protein [Actinoplanes oblitus]|uniref:TusE/DsrC/DsvC family sulfur relay protein n=1 Tax=Actinoplanes oblitus TaxID=3040509 RepID=A0ABY8W8W3_9ACTN|nr:TusE/DsrC/DsvC family sulfur relay protein [Actinoplanes oblitus]
MADHRRRGRGPALLPAGLPFRTVPDLHPEAGVEAHRAADRRRRRAAIDFLRRDYAAQGETATLRRVSIAGGIPVKELFALFLTKPAKKMAYIGGLPKPHGCV